MFRKYQIVQANVRKCQIVQTNVKKIPNCTNKCTENPKLYKQLDRKYQIVQTIG